MFIPGPHSDTSASVSASLGARRSCLAAAYRWFSIVIWSSDCVRPLCRTSHDMESTPTRKRGASECPVDRLLKKALASPPPSAPTPDRTEAPNHDEDEQLLESLPSDFMAAITFLKSQIPAGLGLPPVFLRSQLSSILKDTRDIERELDALRRDNVVRLFHLNTGPDEFAVLLTEDYIRVIKQSVSRNAAAAGCGALPSPLAQPVASSSSSRVQLSLIESFCDRVLSRHTDLSISRPHLLHLLSSSALSSLSEAVGNPQRSCSPRSMAHAAARCQEQTGGAAVQSGGQLAAAPSAWPVTLPCPDTQISLLMQAGVLSRDPADDATYMLCVPGMGKVVQWINAGRQELTSLLARRSYLEMPEQLLLSKTKLRRSPLGAAFHLRDLLGLGLVKKVKTTSGPIIRLVRR